MEKQIISVGFELPDTAEGFSETNFWSNNSLSDADIVVFQPSIDLGYSKTDGQWQGRPCLSDSYTSDLMSLSAHWKRELGDAIKAGKTIFIFLCEPEDFFYHTGQKEYKGTKQVSRLVAPYHNYEILSGMLSKPVASKGKSIIFDANITTLLTTYWQECGQYSEFEATLDAKNLQGQNVFWDKAKTKVLGGIRRYESGSTVIFLPILNTGDKSFYTYNEKDKEYYPSKRGSQFSKKFCQLLLSIDAEAKQLSQETPPPEWLSCAEYIIPEAERLGAIIQEINEQIQELEKKKTKVLDERKRTTRAQKLLYENGAPLEGQVLEALKLLGFFTERFADSHREFDAVFVSEDCRMIGEVEGRDTKAIAIGKFDQLQRNIHSDFQREEVAQRAKGVLFGNGFRFTNPSDRACEFTEKCLIEAKTTSVALVRTQDLFSICLYLLETGDKEFAQKCRQAIIATEGDIVKFPTHSKKNQKPPKANEAIVA